MICIPQPQQKSYDLFTSNIFYILRIIYQSQTTIYLEVSIFSYT